MSGIVANVLAAAVTSQQRLGINAGLTAVVVFCIIMIIGHAFLMGSLLTVNVAVAIAGAVITIAVIT